MTRDPRTMFDDPELDEIYRALQASVREFAEEREEDAHIREEYGGKTTTGGGASDPAAISFEGHRRQFAEFLDAIEKGEPYPLNGREARKAVEIILAIYEAADSRSVVSLPL